MKVAVIHDWLNGMRGGEYVLEAILELFPNAEVFTLIHEPGTVSKKIESHRIHTSLLQKLPWGVSKYRYYLPLMPWLIGQFNLSAFDLVVSSSHCVAKGAKKAAHARHVAYLHAPMRYIWERFEDYFGPGRANPLVRLAAAFFRPYLQRWDRKTASVKRIDFLTCNSKFISGQIRKHYQRDAQVIYPFADPARFLTPRQPGAAFLMVGAFAPNKRVDLAIEACNQLKLPLRIVGSGPEEMRLRLLAGPTITFLGSLSNDEIAQEYARCRAFLFPGIEDFGITPIEAMSAGVPVIAYGEGGALETVTPQTGIFFHQASVTSLMEAIQQFEALTFDEAALRQRGREFTKEKFQLKFRAALKI